MKQPIRRKENFLDKKYFVKSLIFKAVGIENDVRIRKMLRHLCSYDGMAFNKYGERKLTNEEMIVAQILKQNQLSPRTVYRWFCLVKAPKETLELVKNNQISMNELVKLSRNLRKRKDPELEKLGKEIIQDIIKVVEAM